MCYDWFFVLIILILMDWYSVLYYCMSMNIFNEFFEEKKIEIKELGFCFRLFLKGACAFSSIFFLNKILSIVYNVIVYADNDDYHSIFIITLLLLAIYSFFYGQIFPFSLYSYHTTSLSFILFSSSSFWLIYGRFNFGIIIVE